MPDRDSRRYRELRQRLVNAENILLHLDAVEAADLISDYPEARDDYLVAKQALSRFLDTLRKKGKVICPNYDRAVTVIEGVKDRECEVHPDKCCGGLTRRKGSCLGQLCIIQRARGGPSYSPGRQ